MQTPNSGVELFCVRSQKLQYWMICVLSFHLRTYAETAPCAWSGFVYLHTNSTEEKLQKILIDLQTYFCVSFGNINTLTKFAYFGVSADICRKTLHNYYGFALLLRMAVIWSFCVYAQNFSIFLFWSFCGCTQKNSASLLQFCA